MMWDFWSLSPESLHQVTILFSDRGTPDGFRHMDGFSSHTFSLINDKNERFYVKYHFKTKQGIKNFTARRSRSHEVGRHPDHSQSDLFSAIAKGNFPKWAVKIQVMPEAESKTYHINPFDLTKVWPHGDYPLIEIGELELNRNPANYFAEVEQAAFEPRNIVPGMGFSPDRMLQGRLISYPDAHRYRLGVNYDKLPVNSRSVRLRPITAMGPWLSRTTAVPRQTTSPTASVVRRRIRAIRSGRRLTTAQL